MPVAYISQTCRFSKRLRLITFLKPALSSGALETGGKPWYASCVGAQIRMATESGWCMESRCVYRSGENWRFRMSEPAIPVLESGAPFQY